MLPIKTEYRREHYYFPRTCENFHPTPDRHMGDTIVTIAAVALITVFVVGWAWGM